MWFIKRSRRRRARYEENKASFHIIRDCERFASQYFRANTTCDYGVESRPIVGLRIWISDLHSVILQADTRWWRFWKNYERLKVRSCTKRDVSLIGFLIREWLVFVEREQEDKARAKHFSLPKQRIFQLTAPEVIWLAKKYTLRSFPSKISEIC